MAGPGAPHVDYFFHFQEHDFIHHVHGRAYALPDYHVKSIKEIEEKLRSGHISHHESEEYFEFLEHLSHELRDVLQQEKAEGISNLELEKHLRKVAALMNQLAAH